MNRPWFGLVVVAAMAVFGLAVFPSLPDGIPVRWDADGGVVERASRWPAAFLGPAVGLGIWLLLWLLPKIDPRREHYRRFRGTYWLIGSMVLLFLALMQLFALGSALGWPLEIDRALQLAAGLFFLALGNVLPRVRSNWWLGIRTPWTLESETVWRDTHRLAGRTFVAGGLITLAGALLPAELRPYAAMAGIAVGGFVPVVYSYLAWRREARERRV